MAENKNMNNNYKKINLLQHIGTGVPNTEEAWKWYRKFFGLDIPMFDSVADAPLMNIYTNNNPVNKRATMVLNMQGGCAMEIVELKSIKCKKPETEIMLGDYGIFITKIKVKNVQAAYKYFTENAGEVLSGIKKSPDNNDTFYVKDINGLIFQIVQDDASFSMSGHVSGGITGCVIGVSNIEKSKKFYCDLLGFDKIIYDKTGVFEDWASVPGGLSETRRILLSQSKGPLGAFSEFSGPAYIELVQVLDRTPKKIFQNRIWGDSGFIHLCFDVKGMAQIGEECAQKGFPFTCDSKNVLNMGNHTEVHCTYIEDADGTLVEFTEVYKIPILKKIGWFLDVAKRNPEKPLPSWMLKGMRFSRVKD